MRDRRWGTWHALPAIWRQMALAAPQLGLDPEAPWPFAYENRDGTFWVPASLGLPVILERCLVLCSGRSPQLRELQRGSGVGRRGGGIVGADAVSGQPLVVLPDLYSEFAPPSPKRPRKWLCYSSVPREVAEKVAQCLGGALEEVDLKKGMT